MNESQKVLSKSQSHFLLSIVIPTFNRCKELKETLDILKAQIQQDFEILVIDNSSSDDTASMIEAEKSIWQNRLRYYVKDPQGPAGARNLGIDKSNTDFILFLDSDVGLHPDWINKAFSFIVSNPKIGAVGGVVVYDFDHERVNAFGGDIGKFGLAWDENEDTKLSDLKGPERRIWANCSAMIARKSTLLEIGKFDVRFFYGYEDSDVGWRINILGQEVWVLPDLIAYHRVDPAPGQSNSVIVKHYCKNRLSSLLQNASGLSLCYKLPLYLGYSLVDMVLRGPRMAKFAGLAWNVKHINETLSRRGVIQNKRKVSDSTVMNLGKNRMFPEQALNGQRRRSVQLDGAMQQTGKSKLDDRV